MNDEAVAAALRNLGDSVSEFRHENAAQHSDILDEARKTNARIKSLELWRARLEGAGTTIKLIWIVAIAITGILGGIFGDVLVKLAGK